MLIGIWNYHEIDMDFKQELKDKRPRAIYFLVQEEICYNAKTRQEEPLAIQKLKIRHLSQISNYRVLAVSENEAESNKDELMQKVNDFLNEVESTETPQQANNEEEKKSKMFDAKAEVKPDTSKFEKVGYSKDEEEEYDPFGDIDENEEVVIIRH